MTPGKNSTTFLVRPGQGPLGAVGQPLVGGPTKGNYCCVWCRGLSLLLCWNENTWWLKKSRPREECSRRS